MTPLPSNPYVNILVDRNNVIRVSTNVSPDLKVNVVALTEEQTFSERIDTIVKAVDEASGDTFVVLNKTQ